MQHFQFYPDICVKYLGVETYFWKMCTPQDFSLYPEIFAKICVCVGVGVCGEGGKGGNRNTEIGKHSFCFCTLRVFKEWMGEEEKPILECL